MPATTSAVLPKNLRELMQSEQLKDFTLKYIFSLELKHTLPGYFPLKVNNQVLYTTDKNFIIKLGEFIQTKSCNVFVFKGMVDKTDSVFYCVNDSVSDTETEYEPLQNLKDFGPELLNEQIFYWSKGLVSSNGEISREDLQKQFKDFFENF